MDFPNYDDVEVGFELPPLAMAPITRRALAIYCGASGDHNPVHVDSDFAAQAGLGDVIAHGMLIMAYTGRMLTQWVPQTAILSFDTRFQAMTHIGDAITAHGHVTEKLVERGRRCVRVALVAIDQRGEVKTSGNALIALT